MSVKKSWKSLPLTNTKQGTGASATIKKTIREAWTVDDVADRTAAIEAVPEAALGQGHWEDGNAVVVRNDGVMEKWGLWLVTADYETPDEEDDTTTGGEGDDGVYDPPGWDWEDGNASVEVDTDIHGNPLLNSSLDAFDPPDTRDIATGFFTVTTHVSAASFTAEGNSEVRNKVNNDSLTTPYGTFQPLEVRCVGRGPTESFVKGMKKIHLLARFEVRLLSDWPTLPEGISPFDHEFLDVGLRGWYQDSATTLPDIFRAKSATSPVSEAIRLDGTGKPFAADQFKVGNNRDPEEAPAPPAGVKIQSIDNAVKLYYEKYHRAALGGLLPSL